MNTPHIRTVQYVIPCDVFNDHKRDKAKQVISVLDGKIPLSLYLRRINDVVRRTNTSTTIFAFGKRYELPQSGPVIRPVKRKLRNA